MFFDECECVNTSCSKAVYRFDLSPYLEIFMFIFIFIGSVVSLWNIMLVFWIKSLQTSFSVLIVSQAAADIVLCINTFIFEGSYAAARVDINIFDPTTPMTFQRFLFQWMFEIVVFLSNNCIIDPSAGTSSSYCLVQLAVFINTTMESFIAVIRFLKSCNRVSAMYFPVKYNLIFTTRNTIRIVIVSMGVLVICYLPFLILTTNCAVDLDATGFYFQTPCSTFYYLSKVAFETLIYTFCFIFDVACVIKLRQMSKNSSSNIKNNENGRNKKLIVQNIINLTAAIIILVPFGLYSLSACRDYIGQLVFRGYLATEYWNRRFLTNNAFSILQILSRKSTLRIVGHALEETFIFVLQCRLAKVNFNTSVQQIGKTHKK